MSGGGSLSPIASVVGQIGQTPTSTPSAGAAYTPVQQGPVYRPQYQTYQPQQQQSQYQQQQQQMPNYQSGLQAALMQMMQQYSRPAMRVPLQQGISPSNPMAYRPNMPTDNLRRIASPVTYEQMHPIVSPGGGGYGGGGGGDGGGAAAGDGGAAGGDGGSGGGDGGGGGAGGERAGGLLAIKRDK